MIFTYLKMKKQELKFKLTCYTYLNNIIVNSQDIISIINTLFNELKGSSPDEIKDLFMNSLAKVIHEQAEKERSENGS